MAELREETLEQKRYDYQRCEFRGAEWVAFRADGYQTISVSEKGMALMRRERSTSEVGSLAAGDPSYRSLEHQDHVAVRGANA